MNENTKYPGLVNRKRVIATLEDKANITGFRWSPPKNIPDGFVENRNAKTGKFLYYSLTERVSILDVDGREKVTIKTSFYEQDKQTPCEKPSVSIGVWVDGLAGAYHGRKSANWTQEHLTLSDIIAVLNAGYAFAPGLYNQPEGESHRSGDYCEYRWIILFDGDEWSDQHPAPPNFNALLDRYPDLATDFYWIGESISSRSSLKPKLRCRLMLVLPKAIHKGETDLWHTAVDWAVKKYPFIARGVGFDKVRLSFGNARPECDNRVLGGIVSSETFTEWQQIASEKHAKSEELRLEQERLKQERRERSDRDSKLKSELARRGHTAVENIDPIVAFCEVDAATLLTEKGLATRLSGNTWNWHESSQGRSFELENGIIKPFSNTMQSVSPEADGTKPVNAHRFIAFCLYNLDMTKDSDKRDLRCQLANNGYGTHPDDYKQSKRAVKIAGVREGLISPLELRKPVKPLPEERTVRVLQTLNENSKEIAKAFQQKARVVGLRAGTGEGKTEGAVSLAVDGRNIAMSLNTLPLAEQVYNRFDAAETHTFLWRSRWYGYKDKSQVSLIPLRERIRLFERSDVLCIKPHLCKASQDRGVPAPVAVCSTCEVRDTCISEKYLSQTQDAQKTQVLCIAQPKLFIDPLYRGFLRQLSQGQPSDRVCVIDEAKAHDLFIECSLSKTVLQQWVSDWAGESLGAFAEKVLGMLEVKGCSPYEVAELVNGHNDNELRVLSRQCSRFRISYKMIDRGATDKETKKVYAYHSVEFENGVSAYMAVDFKAYDALLDKGLPALPPQEVSKSGYLVLTPAQAFSLSVHKPTDMDGINALPRLWEQSNWTPFQQLKAFIERYQREVDAPIWYVDGVLRWVIPPVVHSRVKHLVCMSATLQREGFERAFDGIPTTFIETSPTHWTDGAKAYQVRTGAYPRRSLFNSVQNESRAWEPVQLTGTGKKFIQIVENEVARDRTVKHVLITTKGVIMLCGKELTERHSNLDVLSFHKMEGLDWTDSGLVFWILGCPEISAPVVEQRAQVLYGNDSETLNYGRDKESRQYFDRRVQLCWESEVTALMQQAVGRARLNRLANTVIVFSNVLIPDFTGRAVGFVPEDMEVAGSITNLEEVANQRLKAESVSPEPYKETRKDREKEKQEARERKAEQKSEVYRLYNSGVSKAKIKEITGVSRPTIDKWLSEFKF